MLSDLQRQFSAALASGDATALLPRLVDGRPGASRRFDVHGQTFFATLIEALQAAFPAVRELVGDGFFDATSEAYVRESPPARPQLLAYGDRFADFLAAFAPARDLPYLPDVARLEWAFNDAHFAADARPLDAAALAARPPADFPRLRFRLHPSARLVASAYPVLDIWRACRPEVAGEEPVDIGLIDLDAGGQQVLLVRPSMRVDWHRLGIGEHRMLAGLGQGESLEQAAGAAMAVDAAFDLRRVLAVHLAAGSFAADLD